MTYFRKGCGFTYGTVMAIALQEMSLPVSGTTRVPTCAGTQAASYVDELSELCHDILSMYADSVVGSCLHA